MPLDSPIISSDLQGVKWAKLQRFLRLTIDNAGISYTMSNLLSDIKPSDTEGQKWAKLGAWMQLLADNIGGGGGGGPAAAGTLTGTTLAANVVNSALQTFGAGVAVLKTETVTLSDAQIKTSPTTGVQIVAAPGAGKALLLLRATFQVAATAGAYVSPDGEIYIAIRQDGTAVSNYVPNVLVSLTGGANGIHPASPFASVGTIDFDGLILNGPALLENLPFLVQGSGTNLTGGNASNTLKVTVWYVEVDV